MAGRPAHVEMIHDAVGLARLVERLSAAECVVIDTESNSFHRFPDNICLVQIAAENRAWVIDPLEFRPGEIAPLGDLLANPGIEKVMHAAANDIRAFDKEWSFRTVNVFDTSTAAQFCGMDTLGLTAVLEEALGIVIIKSRSLQRADWTLRPLSDAALQYAVDDVRHLQSLRHALGARLAELGRTEWAAEEFRRLEDVRYRPPDPPEVAFLSTKGSRDLTPQALAVLREIYIFRHNEGLRRGVPPFRVLSDAALTEIAQAGDADLFTPVSYTHLTLPTKRIV